jgi:DNA-binding MarR family transcriptional regulator
MKQSEQLMYLVLILSMRDGNTVRLPLKEIARRCKCSVPWVSANLRALTQMGLIEREDRFGGRGNCATIIIL